jgi:hypothetical protein
MIYHLVKALLFANTYQISQSAKDVLLTSLTTILSNL